MQSSLLWGLYSSVGTRYFILGVRKPLFQNICYYAQSIFESYLFHLCFTESRFEQSIKQHLQFLWFSSFKRTCNPVKIGTQGTNVFDVIYNPTETQLIRKARSMGKNAVGGSAMLVWQAVRAHEIWNQETYNPEDIQKLIQDMEQEVNRLFPEK